MRKEDALQIAVAKFLHHALPADAIYTGIEHAGKSSIIAGAIRKAKGIRRGLPDLLVWYRGRHFGIELKTATGVQSDAQREFARAMVANGFGYHVCRSIEAVEAAVASYQIPLRATSGGHDARLEAQLAAPKAKRAARKEPASMSAKAKRFQRALYE